MGTIVLHPAHTPPGAALIWCANRFNLVQSSAKTIPPILVTYWFF